MNSLNKTAEGLSKTDVKKVVLDMKKILLATDGSAPSVEATKHAVALAKLMKAELMAIYVDDTVALSPLEKAEFGVSEAVEHGKKGLTVAKWYGEKNGVKVKTITERGSAPKHIVETAEQENVDLIVMGTIGRTGLNRITIGSVAEMVIKAAHIPVLVVR
ncbi:MAG: universal stress protein [Methanosarcinales archaeon Met12]|nr:MAG: universal stress protein [Methanosarcinales archaeon Met12]